MRSPPRPLLPTTGPISADDFQDMEENQVPDEQVVAAIQQRGISFKPTDKDYASYKGMGVDSSIIVALQKAKYVQAENKPKSPYKKTAVQTQGSPDKAFTSAAATSEGVYGVPCIVHACLETHGSAIEWPAEKEVVGSRFHTKCVWHCGAVGRAAQRSRRKHQSVAAKRGRWLR